MKAKISIKLFICWVTALLFLSTQANALTVENMRFGSHPDKTRLVLDLSQKTDFSVFTLGNPYRLIIDMPSFHWNVQGINAPPGSVVKDIRTGAYQSGLSRIVIDLSKPVSVQSAFLLPSTAHKPNRLVIDFLNTSPANFEKTKQASFGTLEKNPEPQQVKSNFNADLNTKKSSETLAVPRQKPVIEKKVIIIDPGHGGQDPGAVAPNKIYEKHITLSTAKELKKQLEATGRYIVKLTRDHDKFIKLHKRVAVARKEKADLFISIHADSIRNKNVRGASFYTLSNKASDAQTEKLAARENRADLIAGVDLSHEDEDVANILLDLAMRDTMNQSKFFANTLVEKSRRNGIRILEKPHRYAGFAVLKAPDIPSVLVEIGFMSNRQEVQLLRSSSYQRKVALTLVDGINAYFDQLKKNGKS